MDSAVSSFSYRSWDLWLLGYPEAALSDADQAVSDARQLDQAATLIYALASVTQTECGNYATASAQLEEATALAEEKGAAFWKGIATMVQGRVLALTGDSLNAIQAVTSGITAVRVRFLFWFRLISPELRDVLAKLRL